MKSNDVSVGWLVEVPPDRQLSPRQLQLTSFAASLSLQPGSDETRCGEITTVSSMASPRKAAVIAVWK